MAKCYAYGRHSTSKQGMTREVQEQSCEDYFNTRLKSRGFEYAGFFYDKAQSGGTIFSEREYGRQVYFSLKPGDYLITADMSRLFRNKTDGFVTLDQLDRKGVKRVILDLPDLSGLEGDAEMYDLLESNLVVYGHMYRRMQSRKMRRDNEVKRENGIPFSRSSPVGWKQVGTRQSKAYRVNDYERTIVDFMHTLIAEGQSHDDVALWYCHAEEQGKFRGKTIRRFTTAAMVRWALRARRADYPMITNRAEFTKRWSSGQIALNRA